MNGWDMLAQFIWIILCTFLFVAYLFVLWYIITDLFRDHKLNGWFKALWIIWLIFMPFISALVYLIARGKSMAKRQQAAAQASQVATDTYIKSVAGAPTSVADQIAAAKALLDSGAITQDEYNKIKASLIDGGGVTSAPAGGAPVDQQDTEVLKRP